jgi:hypothetical protein
LITKIWFRNIRFRNAIYTYQPGSNDLGGVLQYIFAEMEMTEKKIIDVVGLTKILELNPFVQQDALEFSKLLLSLLESVTSRNPMIHDALFHQVLLW